jgi:cytoskeletal protein CcmA (bactofilin family)
MAKQTINIGSNANDGTGDPLRTAFNKINDNFTELYGSDNNLNTLDANLDVNNYIITTGVTNGNITITPNGTGSLTLGALTVSGTEISSADSTQITLKENLSVTGTLNAAGAATLGTSLTLAAGATITEFATSTSLGTSDTKVPTQNAVKVYVDAQMSATAITFVGDDSTGTAVNSGETFKIVGGTGLTSAVTGDAITLDIDSSVVTLTGGQTLTNKTLTSPTIGGTPIIAGVTATGATGTGNLVFSAGPTLTGTLAAATITASGTLSVTGNTTISGSLTTTDITTTGNQTVTGNITAQGTVFSDRIKSPATNANLAISAQGTGIVDIQSAMTTIGQTITGTASVTGQFNADNLRIDGNVISSTDTNGDVIITPNGSGQITLSSSRVGANQLNAVTVAVSNSVDTNTLRSYSSNADIVVQPQGTGTVDFKVPAQSTVGAAGGASALPGTPTGYFTIKVNGSTFVVPYYAQS